MTIMRNAVESWTGPARAMQRVRAIAAALAGAVIGFFHLVPLVATVIDRKSPVVFLAWALPLASAIAAGIWAAHSAFGCRLLGVCALLTAPLALLGLLLLPLAFASASIAVTIFVPAGVAAVGLLGFLAGSPSLDRLLQPGSHVRRAASRGGVDGR